MTYDNEELYTDEYWEGRMPPLPDISTAGAPLVLTPEKAGKILHHIAYGLPPRASFAIFGISVYSYERYLRRFNKTKDITMMSEPNQCTALGQATDEDKVNQYIFAYFQLQGEAVQASQLQFARAQLKILNGSPTTETTIKKAYKTREVKNGHERMTLVDQSEMTTTRYIERPPKLPKDFWKKMDC
jgi:hypothetical protein